MESKVKPMAEHTANDLDAFEAHRARYKALLQEGKWKEARSHIDRVLELRPDYAPAHNQLGVYYFNEKDPEHAEACFRRAIQLDFTLVEAHFNLASLYQSDGNYEEALPHFKEAVTANPDDYETYNRMGACCLVLGAKEDAEVFLEEALRLRPDFLDPLVSLTVLYMEQGRLSEAEAKLKEGLKAHPEIPQLRFTLGLVLKSQGKFEEALGAFREVVLSDGGHAEAFNHLGECCVALNMGEQAEPFFAQAAKLDPEMSSAVFNLGKLYHDQERWDDAIVMFEEWLKQEDPAADLVEASPEQNRMRCAVYHMLGTCYAARGDREQARELWERALEIAPDQTEIAAKLEELPQPLHRRVSLTIDD